MTSAAHAQAATGIRPATGRIQVSALVVNAAEGAALGSRTLMDPGGAPVKATRNPSAGARRVGVAIGSPRQGELSVVVESVVSSLTGGASTDVMVCRRTGARPDCQAHALQAPVAIRPSSEGVAESLLLFLAGPSGDDGVLRATIAYTAN